MKYCISTEEDSEVNRRVKEINLFEANLKLNKYKLKIFISILYLIGVHYQEFIREFVKLYFGNQLK